MLTLTSNIKNKTINNVCLWVGQNRFYVKAAAESAKVAEAY